MRSGKYILAAVAMAMPAWAGTVSITNANQVEVATGDELRFNFQAWNFAQFTQSSLPTRVAFMFSVLPLGGPAPRFQASLENSDRSLVLDFDNAVTTGDGFMRSAFYQGAVTAFSDSLSLDAKDALNLLGSTGKQTATLVLRDVAGGATLKLTGYSLAQAMTISLSNATVSMGAVRGSVSLDQAGLIAVAEARVGGVSGVLSTPEPGAFSLAALGLLFALAGGVRKKLL